MEKQLLIDLYLELAEPPYYTMDCVCPPKDVIGKDQRGDPIAGPPHFSCPYCRLQGYIDTLPIEDLPD